MNQDLLKAIPEESHGAVREAVISAFGAEAIASIEGVPGGASGAAIYKLGTGGRFYLLRVENRRNPFRNPHQNECMRIASEAGIAPPLRYFSDASGVVIMDFIEAQPLGSYPGGPGALAKALGHLAAQLQATTPFPVLGDYRMFLTRLISHIGNVFAPGVLSEHLEAFERIRAVYPWDAETHLSSHNDPNPNNILYDGRRLWLIDWETAYRNDAFADVSILVEYHAESPELEGALLNAWLDGEPSRLALARLKLMRQLTRLYYAGLLALLSGKPEKPIADLQAPTRDEFRAMAASGEIKPTARETMVTLCKMCLAAVQGDVRSPAFEEALAVCKAG